MESGKKDYIYKKSRHDILVKVLEVDVNGMPMSEKMKSYDFIVIENEDRSRELKYKYKGFKVESGVCFVWSIYNIYLRFDLSEKIKA